MSTKELFASKAAKVGYSKKLEDEEEGEDDLEVADHAKEVTNWEGKGRMEAHSTHTLFERRVYV